MRPAFKARRNHAGTASDGACRGAPKGACVGELSASAPAPLPVPAPVSESAGARAAVRASDASFTFTTTSADSHGAAASASAAAADAAAKAEDAAASAASAMRSGCPGRRLRLRGGGPEPNPAHKDRDKLEVEDECVLDAKTPSATRPCGARELRTAPARHSHAQSRCASLGLGALFNPADAEAPIQGSNNAARVLRVCKRRTVRACAVRKTHVREDS